MKAKKILDILPQTCVMSLDDVMQLFRETLELETFAKPKLKHKPVKCQVEIIEGEQ